MGGSFSDFQVLYSDGPPADAVRLGQLLVDESEADPADMLKVCTDLSPLTYTSVQVGSVTVPTGANPTGTIGLAAVNGSAVTFLRSDGAPALGVTIVPTWSGVHTFTADPCLTLNRASPSLRIQNTAAAANNQNWIALATGSTLQVLAYNDAYSVGAAALSITHGSAAPSSVDMPLDNLKLRLGASQDLSLYHDGTNNIIRTDNGRLNFLFGATKRFQIAGNSGAGSAIIMELSDSAGTAKAYYGIADAANDIINGSLAGDLMFRTQAEQILFSVDSGASAALQINTSGALGLAGATYGTSGQVLTSGGSAAAPTWTTLSDGATNPALGYYYNTDFIQIPTTNGLGGSGWDAATSGASSAFASITSTAAHPGIIGLSTGTANTGYSGCIMQADSSAAGNTGQVVGGGIITQDWIFKLVTLPVVTTNEATIRLGASDEINGLPNNFMGICSQYSSGYKLYGCVRTAGSDAFTTSNFAPAADTWYHARTVINAAGTSMEFFIGLADGSTALTSLGTLGSLVAISLAPSAQYYRTAAGTQLVCHIDFFQIEQLFTTARWTQ